MTGVVRPVESTILPEPSRAAAAGPLGDASGDGGGLASVSAAQAEPAPGGIAASTAHAAKETPTLEPR